MSENRRIELDGKEIYYKLKKRKGSKAVKLSVYDDGYISVIAPKWYPLYLIEKFIKEKSQWILDKIQDEQFFLFKEERLYKEQKDKARKLITKKVEKFNNFYNFSYNRIAIRNQRSCWGSCSEKKNLNFSYKIIKLPEDLQDYVIVHELCHLKELNHSNKFWKLVKKQIPEFKNKRKKLIKIKI